LEGKEPSLIAKELNVHYQTVLNIFHHAFSLLYRCNDNVIDLLKEKVEIEAERARVNNSVLDKKIENVNFSKRLKNICKQHGLITIRDLASLSRTEFSEFDGLGKKSLSEVRDFFDMYYLDFGYIENGREENT
jgi:DNA-directed RNA polymerase alpha subunit